MLSGMKFAYENSTLQEISLFYFKEKLIFSKTNPNLWTILESTCPKFGKAEYSQDVWVLQFLTFMAHQYLEKNKIKLMS